MKRTMIIMGAAALISLGATVKADEPNTGHSTEVIPGEWDDEDPKLNFNFQDIPAATYTRLHLNLVCGLPDAKIFYTTDPKAKPTDEAAWTEYTGPLYLTEDCTVRFFARCEGYEDSDIQEYIFVFADHQTKAPVIAPDIDRTSLVMVTETPDAEIRYTTDGSEPTEASQLYGGPVLLDANGIFRAKAFARDMFGSDITDYTVDFLTVANPTAAFENCALVLATEDPKAKILYTTDQAASTEDTEAWTLYTAPIPLSEDCTIRFYGQRDGYNDSEVQSFSFAYSAFQVEVPQLEADAEGTHVVMTCATDGAEIRYTTDGSEPTQESLLYTEPVEIVSNGVFRARAFADGLFDSNIVDFTVMHLAVPTPTAAFENKQLVIACDDTKATVWYTTNPDATPADTDAWTEYKAPLALTENCTVRFYGRRDNFNDSDIQSFVFVYSNYQVADPLMERNEEGTHLVMETPTPGATIYYTTDGSEPTTESSVYTEPVLIEGNLTYTAIAVADGLFDSKSNRYVVSGMEVTVPYANFENLRMTLTCADAKASIWYTLNPDATPEDMSAWTLYTAPFEMTEDGTIYFFSRRENLEDSDIETFVFLRANYTAAAPQILRNEDRRELIMTTETEGAEIRYTTDGSEPTEESELYTDPIFLTQNCTFRARTFADGLFESEISEYSVANLTMMMPYATFENLLLNLSVWDDAAAVWYTLDPEATPENVEAWTLYTEPLALDGDCTVRFFARRTGFLDSQIATYDHVYADWQAAAPEIAEDRENNVVTISCATEGAEIRYTLDGSEPTAESELYTGPIALTNRSMTIKARAFAEGLYDSAISEIEVSGTTGVEAVSADGLKVTVEGGEVVVYSDKAVNLPVYTLDGRMVRIVEIKEGRNAIDALDSNVYIIGGVRIKL